MEPQLYRVKQKQSEKEEKMYCMTTKLLLYVVCSMYSMYVCIYSECNQCKYFIWNQQVTSSKKLQIQLQIGGVLFTVGIKSLHIPAKTAVGFFS